MAFWRRFDSKPTEGIPAYRRMVPFLMRGRNESAVYFEQTIDLSATLPFLAEVNRSEGPRVTLFHVILGAIAQVLHERPRLNRFVSGRRIHDREGIHISFAAKKRFDDDAPLSVVKREFTADEPLRDLVARLAERIGDARSDKQSSIDKEMGLLLKLPTVALDGAVRLVRALDFLNLAPRALLEHDPMYCSVFVANLGSINIDAAYHHLYEYGNCPLFLTIGRIERAPVVTADDRIEPRDVVRLKYTFDERIEDGLYCARALERLKALVEDPAQWAD